MSWDKSSDTAGARSGGNLVPLPLKRQRRAVLVRVVTHGHEVDSFLVSEPRTLRAAVRPIYAHLPADNAVVQFKGVEEEWLPLGIGKTRREAELKGLDDALRFLVA